VTLKLVITTLVCKTGNKFVAICASGEKLLQETTGIRRRQVYQLLINEIGYNETSLLFWL